jgi:hypothetical protein
MKLYKCLAMLGVLGLGVESSVLWAVDLFTQEPTVDYSAVREITSAEGSVTMKEYYSSGNRRIEMAMGGMSAVVIDIKKEGKAYMLMPDMKMYMEMPSGQMIGQTGDVDALEQEKVGSETLDGHKVDKYKARFNDDEGNQGEGYYWVTKDAIVLKIDMAMVSGEDEAAFVMQLKDLRVGKQEPSLFSIPAGYTAAPAMGGAMPPGMMPQ